MLEMSSRVGCSAQFGRLLKSASGSGSIPGLLVQPTKAIIVASIDVGRQSLFDFRDRERELAPLFINPAQVRMNIKCFPGHHMNRNAAANSLRFTRISPIR